MSRSPQDNLAAEFAKWQPLWLDQRRGSGREADVFFLESEINSALEKKHDVHARHLALCGDRCQHFLHLVGYFLFVARRGRLVQGHGFDRLLPINIVSTKLGVPVVRAWVANVPRENLVVGVGTSTEMTVEKRLVAVEAAEQRQ